MVAQVGKRGSLWSMSKKAVAPYGKVRVDADNHKEVLALLKTLQVKPSYTRFLNVIIGLGLQQYEKGEK